MLSLLLSLVVTITIPPLLVGVINCTKAFFGGRQGPPVLQPYFDLWRLAQKGTVQSTTTTWLFRFGTVVNLVTLVMASMFIPLARAEAPVSFTGDLFLFAYLLALGRFFLVLSALDTGSSFEGMGVARELTFACFTEPTVFFCLLVLAKVFGSLRMAEMFEPFSAASGMTTTLLLLTFLSWFLLTLAENCRIPFDDPNTHLELTMIHEVIVLDHSGPLLATVQYASALKMFIFASLGVRLAIPLQFANFWAAWAIFLVCLILMAVVLGTVESVMARLRMPRVPQMLTAASVVAAFGFVLLVTNS